MPAPNRILLLAFPDGQLLDTPAHSRCLRQPMTSYRRHIASRSQHPRQDHLQLRPEFDLSRMFHLCKSPTSVSLASTHSSRLAVSRACDRNLCAEMQPTLSLVA